jgi:hypothetical protein
VAQWHQKIRTMTNKCEDDAAVDNSDEDVFANFELLLEATKFDDSNVSHDVEVKMKPVLLIPHQVMFEAQVRYTNDYGVLDGNVTLFTKELLLIMLEKLILLIRQQKLVMFLDVLNVSDI